ncbi:MAG: glycosyltransferase [Burkholderiales bacterium]|nr:glycosyltransferase [Burkholderiales bacterium]
MRILHVLPSINAVTGGPAKSIPLQLKALAGLGHHVELYTTNWPAIEASESERVLEQDGVIVHVFAATQIWPLTHVPYSRRLIAAVHLARSSFDVYHASSLWNPLITHTLALFRRYRLPYVITCHGMLDPLVFARHRLAKRWWGQAFERANVEGAELVQFTSDQEMHKALRCGWRLRRTLVLPISVDTAAGMDLPQRKRLEADYPQLYGKELIVFVGRVNWVKNLDLLVSALARVRECGRDVLLLCVGPDSDGHRAQLERQAVGLGVGEQVIFTGLLEGEALKAVFARADIVALVSRKENFGLAAAEALAAGVPIVLSDGVDMGKEWETPPVWRVAQNPETIAQGLIAALAYSRDVGVPCAAARALAKREWGDSAVNRLAELYEVILAARHATSRSGCPGGIR